MRRPASRLGSCRARAEQGRLLFLSSLDQQAPQTKNRQRRRLGDEMELVEAQRPAAGGITQGDGMNGESPLLRAVVEVRGLRVRASYGLKLILQQDLPPCHGSWLLRLLQLLGLLLQWVSQWQDVGCITVPVGC